MVDYLSGSPWFLPSAKSCFIHSWQWSLLMGQSCPLSCVTKSEVGWVGECPFWGLGSFHSLLSACEDMVVQGSLWGIKHELCCRRVLWFHWQFPPGVSRCLVSASSPHTQRQPTKNLNRSLLLNCHPSLFLIHFYGMSISFRLKIKNNWNNRKTVDAFDLIVTSG